MIVRAITGIVFIGVIIGSLLWSPYAVTVVFMAFMILGIHEFYGLFKLHDKVDVSSGFGMSLGLVISALALATAYNWITPDILFYTLLPILFIGLVGEIWRKKEEPILNSAILIFGLIYVVLPFLLLIVMHYKLDALGKTGIPLVLGMFLLIWTNDTFAYLSGRTFGKTKLIERVSPNKTWEGTIGGILMTLIVGAVLGYFNNDFLFWIPAAAIIAPCAIIGDLFESVLKRNLGIKDSGSILPGHGGILDRFDATLMAVPFFFLWFSIYMGYF
ncbi:MAG: phosphatidate cytidylyltransferase [Crocinitomicaceae bacterium]|nr:phosphatidate cytidylyltransferase [Crocinitomicaceae bacterium]